MKYCSICFASIFSFLLLVSCNNKQPDKPVIAHGTVRASYNLPVADDIIDSVATAPRTIKRKDAVDSFRVKLYNSKWVKSALGNFLYPSFFHYKEVDGDMNLGSFNVYQSGDVQLSYIIYGVWATLEDDFFSRNTEIAPHTYIKEITYKSNNGVFSGYTKDGRIFYMKLRIFVDGETDHLGVLALVYPTSYADTVKPLIHQVLKWK